MKNLIESCIIFNFDLEDKTPIVHTQYDAKNGNISAFSKTKNDIDASIYLIREQINHFMICVEYLENCDIPLKNFRSVHIVGSTIEKTTHYVEMTNANTENKTQCLFINYKPEIFIKSRFNLLPLSVNFWAKNKNRESNFTLSIGHESENLTKYFNKITLFNCFLYSILFTISGKNDMSTIIERPFKYSTNILLNGILYGMVGNVISNLVPNYSNILFNGVLGYVNYTLYKKLNK